MKTYLSDDNRVHIVFNQTASTVMFIGIDSNSEGHEWTVQKSRIAEFFNNHREANTNIAKLLTNSLIPLSTEVETILRRYIMETTSIFAISMTAEFIGRYNTEAEAFKANPKDAIFPQTVTDITEAKFTKKQLNQLVGLDDKELKNFKSDEMIDKYWAILMTKELTIAKKTAKKVAENKEPKVKSGLIHVIYNALTTAPYYIKLDEFLASENAKLKCFQSLISNLQNEKYSQGLVPLKIERGALEFTRTDDEGNELPETATILYNSDFKPENLIAKVGRKMSDTTEGKAPKAEGLQTKLRTFFNEGGCATKADLAVMFGVEVKNISDQVCYLKNPKFAGTLGSINLITDPNDKTVCIQPEGYVVPEKIKPVKAPKAPKSTPVADEDAE